MGLIPGLDRDGEHVPSSAVRHVRQVLAVDIVAGDPVLVIPLRETARSIRLAAMPPIVAAASRDASRLGLCRYQEIHCPTVVSRGFTGRRIDSSPAPVAVEKPKLLQCLRGCSGMAWSRASRGQISRLSKASPRAREVLHSLARRLES